MGDVISIRENSDSGEPVGDYISAVEQDGKFTNDIVSAWAVLEHDVSQIQAVTFAARLLANVMGDEELDNDLLILIQVASRHYHAARGIEVDEDALPLPPKAEVVSMFGDSEPTLH